jgi:hypothetical protein
MPLNSLTKLAVAGALLACLASRARAEDIVCGLAQDEVIQVDGLADDWDGVKPTLFAGPDRKDAAVSVRCNYDSQNVYLYVDVTDDWVVRRGPRDKKGAEDRISLEIGRARLQITPADPDRHLGRKLVGKARGLVLVDTRREHGFAVELGLPRASAGLAGSPQTAFAVSFTDCDMKATAAADGTIGSPPNSTLSVAEGDALYRQFLADQHYTARDVWFDQRADLDGAPGDERVVAAGRTIGVLSDRYSFVQLPVAKKDIVKLSLETLDWGKKRRSIVVQYIERSAEGSREVLTVWHVARDGAFAKVFAIEVAKASSAGRMVSTWSVVPGKAHKRAGCCLLRVQAATAKGFTEATWHESPATDMVPILLPWGEARQREWIIVDDNAEAVD